MQRELRNAVPRLLTHRDPEIIARSCFKPPKLCHLISETNTKTVRKSPRRFFVVVVVPSFPSSRSNSIFSLVVPLPYLTEPEAESLSFLTVIVVCIN